MVSSVIQDLKKSLLDFTNILYIGSFNEFKFDFSDETIVYHSIQNNAYVWETAPDMRHNIYLHNITKDEDLDYLKGLVVEVILIKRNLTNYQLSVIKNLSSYKEKRIINLGG